MLQQLKPMCLEPVLCNKKHHHEKPEHHNEESRLPATIKRENQCKVMKTQYSQKYIQTYIKKKPSSQLFRLLLMAKNTLKASGFQLLLLPSFTICIKKIFLGCTIKFMVS